MDNSTIKIALCGPSDVVSEIQKAKEIINEFNQQNFESIHIFLKHLHWEDNSTPDLSKRAQESLNFQIIDDADVVVAVFWNRIGTPTGLYDSGTAEEIKRAVFLEKRVMVYFSLMETDGEIDINQKDKLENFKNSLYSLGLCDSFSSHEEFRNKLSRHLLNIVSIPEKNEPEKPRSKKRTVKIIQQQGGSSNVQAYSIGNITVKTPKPARIPIQPSQDCVTQEELKRIKDWISELAEGEPKKSRDRAYPKWTNIFKRHLNVNNIHLIKSEQMKEAEEYFTLQRNLQKAGKKTEDPEAWRKDQYRAIKAWMRTMGKTEESYYPELAVRLKIKPGFTSLTNLTKDALTKVRNAVKRDLEAWKKLRQ